MIDGVRIANELKKKILIEGLKKLEAFDPELAHHMVSAQREVFKAGQAFFESEVGHADRFLEKLKAKQEQDGTGTPPQPSRPDGPLP